ncbi:MAG: winged helix-turn-helix domain-containing protein [Kangiellaceae bacterium]|nr:winged helix-turn-helix domain-containing protein [Kangiellaceae bacterium]
MENSNHLLQVGEFVLNTSSRKLFDSHNKEVSLSPTLYTLLKFFIEHQNQILTRDMIRSNVWKDKIVVDANVNQNIKKLRDTLGDSVADPKYIETVTGEGFRFVANSEAYKAVPIEKNEWLVYGLILLSFLLLASVIFAPDNKQKVGTQLIELFPITTLKGIEHDPDVSPDLKYILFSYKSQGNWDIYLKPLDKESYFPLIESSNDLMFPKLSFAQDKIVYFEKGDDVRGLFIRKIDLSSLNLGKPTLIKECDDPDGRILAVWKSSEELFISVNEKLRLPASIYLYNLETKNQTLISKPDSKGFGDYSLQYSPELEKLAYIRNIGWSSSEIWVYDLDKQTHSKIKSLPTMLRNLSWEDSEYIYFASGSRELSKISSNGDSEEIVGKFSSNIYLPFKIDSARLGVMIGDYFVVDVSVFNLDTKTKNIAISSSFNDYLGASAGSYVAFVSNRSGEHQIWIRDDQGTDRQITNFKDSFEIQWLSASPDGKFIMYNKSGRTVIINTDGEVIFNSEDYSNQVHYNPVLDMVNGRFLYSTQYQSEWNIEYRTFDELGERITMFEGITARPCAFGDCLLYFKEGDPYLYKYDPVNNSSSKLLEVALISEAEEWDVFDDERILYLDKKRSPNEVIMIDFATGRKETVLVTTANRFSFDRKKNLIYTNVVSEGNTELMYLVK